MAITTAKREKRLTDAIEYFHAPRGLGQYVLQWVSYCP